MRSLLRGSVLGTFALVSAACVDSQSHGDPDPSVGVNAEPLRTADDDAEDNADRLYERRSKHDEDKGKLTLIHFGDLHGHMVPRLNLRDDAAGPGYKGGLARLYRQIRQIRRSTPGSLTFDTGDTVQGSAEQLYTQGQSIVNVLNHFKIDAYNPGNWDYLYGTSRFLDLFGGTAPKAPWNALAANLYYSTLVQDPTTPFPDKAGQRVLPPYIVREVNGIKVGIMGMTGSRPPQVVAPNTVKGFVYTKGDAEVPEILGVLRNTEHVDVVVMLSELGLANNIRLATANPGIDVVLSSDMHEETRAPVVLPNGTMLVEEGQDGTVFGRVDLRVKNHVVTSKKFEMIDLDGRGGEDFETAWNVWKERRTFVRGPWFQHHENPFNHSLLKRPIDSVIGYTAVALQRRNFSDQDMPAVIEGSSHDFLTDAFKAMTGAELGAIRGFRYGTDVKPGPITLEQLYHFMPTGRQIAVGSLAGASIKNQIENAASGSLDPVISNWTGGWLFNFSGVTMDLDPYQANGRRASNILVNGQALVPTQQYRYAAFWYPEDPTLINVLPATNITVLKDDDGSPLDATEVVVRYLATLPNHTANPQLHRTRLVRPLPAPSFGNHEIQPLRGAQP